MELLVFYGFAALAALGWSQKETAGPAFRAALRSSLFVGFTAWAVRGWEHGKGFTPALTEATALFALFCLPRKRWPLALALLSGLPFIQGTAATLPMLSLPFRWAAGMALDCWMRQRRFPVLRTLMHAVSFMGAAAWLLPLHLTHVLWRETGLPETFRMLAPFLAAASLALGTWAAVHLVRTGGTPEPLDPPLRLVTDGPYRYLKHPMQWAESGLVWAAALYWGDTALLVYAGFFTALMMLPMRWREERGLIERFGDSARAFLHS